MKFEEFEFRHFLICESVRWEIGGKQILLGVYAGVIMTTAVPFMWPTCAIRIELLAKKTRYAKAECSVTKPDKKSLFFTSVYTDFEVSHPQHPVALVFQTAPVVFDQLGDYGIQLSMDGPPRSVGSFKVLTQEMVAKSA